MNIKFEHERLLIKKIYEKVDKHMGKKVLQADIVVIRHGKEIKPIQMKAGDTLGITHNVNTPLLKLLFAGIFNKSITINEDKTK